MRCDRIGGQCLLRRLVSIHTPTWGVTPCCRNSRPEHCVSIHTPTWGVTMTWMTTNCAAMSFNPHTYMRCDISPILLLSIARMFQSTHLHEVWPADPSSHGTVDWVSIHTPTWGVTFGCVFTVIQIDVSIHTPTWGVTYFLLFYVQNW